jgi:hypothetical protein
MFKGLNRGRMRVVILPSSSHFHFSSSNIGTPPTFGVQFRCSWEVDGRMIAFILLCSITLYIGILALYGTMGG